MTSTADAFDLLRSAFDGAGVRYAVGGSWASTAFGEPRFTNDVDVLVELTEENLSAFLSLLPETFYVDAEDVFNAPRRCGPFNVIHMSTVLKFDLFSSVAFPLGTEELDPAISLSDSGLSKGSFEVAPRLSTKDTWNKAPGN